MTFQQWVISYLIVGLPLGIFLAHHYSQIILMLLRGKEVTVYGRDVVHANKKAEFLRDSVKDIRKIQHIVSERWMPFIFALVLTTFCLMMVVTWIYQIWKLSTYNCKMQIKETP